MNHRGSVARCVQEFTGAFVTVIALLMAGGCTGYRPPSIQLTGVRLIERSDEAAAFHFDLELQNPNTEPIELREFRYTLSLDGTAVFTGRRAATTTLHSGAGNLASLPAVVRFETMGWSNGLLPDAVEYQLSGTLLYITPGALAEMLLDTGVRKPIVRFNREGRLELPAR